MPKKILIIHPFMQHSYKLLEALCGDREFDVDYCTTMYNKKFSFTNILRIVSNSKYKKKMQKHYCSAISENKVIQFKEFLAILVLIVRTFNKHSRLYSFLYFILLRQFSRKIVRQIHKNEYDAIIMFDMLALNVFKEISNKKIVRIIDMSAPFLKCMYDIYSADNAKPGNYTDELDRELNSRHYQKCIKMSEAEIHYADYFLVASEFTKSSLTDYGIDKKKIFICRYGYNKIFYDNQQNKKSRFNKLKCIYTGNVNQKKGMNILYRLMTKAAPEKYSFTIIGSYPAMSPTIKKMKAYCQFTGFLSHDDMLTIYKETDCMIFPSLADGFGNSVLEAMSSGIIPIVSRNAGVSDLISNGRNGFVFEIEEEEKLFSILENLYEDFEERVRLQAEVKKCVMEITWNKYNIALKSALKKVLP